MFIHAYRLGLYTTLWTGSCVEISEENQGDQQDMWVHDQSVVLLSYNPSEEFEKAIDIVDSIIIINDRYVCIHWKILIV